MWTCSTLDGLRSRIRSRKRIVPLAILLAVALSGCGGSSGKPTPTPGPGTDPPVGQPDPPPVQPGLQLAPGLYRSAAPPVHANAAGDTLANLLGDDSTTLAPLTSAITQTRGDAPSTTVSSAGIHVVGIRSDGQGGYHVTYYHDVPETTGGEEITVHFRASDYDEDDQSYTTTDDGDEVWLSLWNQGYRFFDIGNSRSGQEYVWFVFGARTPPNGLPASGRATWSGRFGAHYWSAGSPDTSRRQRLYGDMRIVANFDLGTLAGEIDGIQGTAPGAPGSTRAAWSTSSFTISDGRMVDGQFTAKVTGRDSDATASLARSVAGYAGSLLGEFYGPAAEEVGAVVTATRDAAGDAHDRVLVGYVGGQRREAPPRGGSYSDTGPFSTGVDRHDFSTSPRIVPQDAGNRVTAVTSDGEGGYRIAYLVDGVSKTVSLGAEDFGSDADYPDAWTKSGDGGSVGYYFDVTDQGYSHVNLSYWSHLRYPDGESDSPEFAALGYVVHGSKTAPESMPTTGSATYAGDIRAESWESRPAFAGITGATRYRGDLTLSADFAAGSIGGEIDGLERRMPGGNEYADISGRLVIGNGRISGNRLSGELSGLGYDGTVAGAFYGPAAAEVGGVLRATDASRNMLHGMFRGKKE